MQQHPLYGGEAYKAAETGPAQIQQPQMMPQQTTIEMQAPVLGYAGGYACGIVWNYYDLRFWLNTRMHMNTCTEPVNAIE